MLIALWALTPSSGHINALLRRVIDCTARRQRLRTNQLPINAIAFFSHAHEQPD
jgi:hypothetical protein